MALKMSYNLVMIFEADDVVARACLLTYDCVRLFYFDLALASFGLRLM